MAVLAGGADTELAGGGGGAAEVEAVRTGPLGKFERLIVKVGKVGKAAGDG